MDSAGPTAARTAGQSTVLTGTNTFGIRGLFKAETFARDWLCHLGVNPAAPVGGHRARHHPSATGERHAA